MPIIDNSIKLNLFKLKVSFFIRMAIKYDIKGVQEYITPECEAVDRLIPFKKHNWFIGITSAPSIRNFILSILSILKSNFLRKKTDKRRTVAVPNLKNARIIG
jgi:hypothetical protein